MKLLNNLFHRHTWLDLGDDHTAYMHRICVTCGEAQAADWQLNDAMCGGGDFMRITKAATKKLQKKIKKIRKSIKED